MARILFFLVICLLAATGIVTWFSNLPKLSTVDKRMVRLGLVVCIIAAIIFFGAMFLLQMDNNNAGVLK